MSQEQWTSVDRFITDFLVKPDDALETALQKSSEAGFPEISVAPNQGKFLHLLALLRGARNILEIGTLAGYSTIWLARALPADGHLISLESDAKCVEVATANIARAGLSHIVDIRLGLALDTLPQLAAENRSPFDLIFIDADKKNTPEYLTWAIKLARLGSLIIVDNVVRNGAVIDAKSADLNVQGMRRFYELLGTESRVVGTAIQTVGSKGYDGFAMVLVTADK
jgi:predicted O-methyltransferase YrrM